MWKDLDLRDFVSLCFEDWWEGQLATMLLPLALALPHILYAVIWMRPQWWKAIFKTKEKAVGAFEIAAAVGKGLVYVWCTISETKVCEGS